MKVLYSYFTYKLKVRGLNFTILVVKDGTVLNYISISKDMPNNRRGTLGREFRNYEDAKDAYKSQEIKSELDKIELGLVEPFDTDIL